MSSLTFISQQISIYFGIPVLVAGLFGGVLNSLVFLSLRTFRQSSCAFYLTIMSVVNIGQLLTGLLPRILISGYDVDWTITSPFYCKFRYFLYQTCSLISLTCICLATIDQYLATCSNVRWQQWSSLKVAHRLIAIFAILWSLHGIPYLIYFAQVYYPLTNTIVCGITNDLFFKYFAYGFLLILTGFLPIFITILFAILAFRNVKQLVHQAVPVVRRELEKQLTMIVLVQVALNSFTLLPNSMMAALQTDTALTSDPEAGPRIQFASVLGALIFYLNFAVSENRL